MSRTGTLGGILPSKGKVTARRLLVYLLAVLGVLALGWLALRSLGGGWAARRDLGAYPAAGPVAGGDGC